MVVITCAGLGSRFKGYINYPKQLLLLKNGKYLIESIIENVKGIDENIVLVCNENNYKYFKFLGLPIVIVDKLKGSAYSGSYAIKDENEPLAVIDGDGFYSKNIFKELFEILKSKNCCVVDSALKDPTLYSFVCVENGKVIKTIEKESGGDYGIIGIYGFRNTQEYKQAVNKMLETIKPKEYTNALVYNFLENNTYLETKDYIILGTPKQYEDYLLFRL